MDLRFATDLGSAYHGPTQRIRILSEDWLQRNMYCPACGADRLTHYRNNKPVADFHCVTCGEDYELKSQAKPFTTRVADGAYSSMIERLKGATAPNFLFLFYNKHDLTVRNLMLVPNHFMTGARIEKRPPLAANARRSGWTGCNILLESIPPSGRINVILDTLSRSKEDVLRDWEKTAFLRDQQASLGKSWLLDVMRVIENLNKQTFSLLEVYAAAADLQSVYPRNDNIKPKIRQQLQVLRDKGYLAFVDRGQYALRP